MDSFGTLTPEDSAVTVRFSVALPAPPDRVWQAITDPQLIACWLADAEFEAELGGRVHLTWPGQDQMHGVVLDISPPEYLSYSWIEEGGSSELSFDLAPAANDSTLLTLTHRGTSVEDAPGFGAGWHSHLESLELVLSDVETSAEQRDARYHELRPQYTTPT
jgi:uncharacterized protein YndB with AHSA1/START domain